MEQSAANTVPLGVVSPS